MKRPLMMCLTTLHVGGLVAVGFDVSGRYLLTVSHAGRAVYDTATWKRVARDDTLAYPTDGVAVGIGPIADLHLQVTEIDYGAGVLEAVAPNGKFSLSYAEGIIAINSTGA